MFFGKGGGGDSGEVGYCSMRSFDTWVKDFVWNEVKGEAQVRPEELKPMRPWVRDCFVKI